MCPSLTSCHSGNCVNTLNNAVRLKALLHKDFNDSNLSSPLDFPAQKMHRHQLTIFIRDA